MVQVRNRRSIWSYLRLPAGVLALLVLVSQLAAIDRSALIAQLERHVAQGSTQEALAAVFQLAAMRPAPADALVAAAAATNPEIAAGAKSAINNLLYSYSDRIQENRRVADVADDLVAFSAALDAQQKSFTANDQAWVAQTTHHLVRLANSLPDSAVPLLAARCEAILDAARGESPSPAAAYRPAPFDPGAFANQVAAQPTTPMGNNNVLRPSTEMLNPFLKVAPANVPEPAPPASPNIDATPSPATRQSPVDWRPPRSSPAFPAPAPITMRIVPAQPVATSAIDEAPPPRPIESAPQHPASQSLSDSAATQLLGRWLSTTGADAAAIEQEMARRGFGRLSRPFVERLFSEKPADRLQLVDGVLSQPGGGAREWLLLLAQDPHADVRLAAITALATSNDPALLEKAYQTAIRDRDPRIANLAARLNQRRTSAPQR